MSDGGARFDFGHPVVPTGESVVNSIVMGPLAPETPGTRFSRWFIHDGSSTLHIVEGAHALQRLLKEDGRDLKKQVILTMEQSRQYVRGFAGF